MLHADDRIMGILPFFHSFGFTGTLCLPAATGIGVVFHPNPLDSRVIGRSLVNKYASPCFSRPPDVLERLHAPLHHRKISEACASLGWSGELPDRISQAFEDHFGIRRTKVTLHRMFAGGYGETIDFRAASFAAGRRAKRGSMVTAYLLTRAPMTRESSGFGWKTTPMPVAAGKHSVPVKPNE